MLNIRDKFGCNVRKLQICKKLKKHDTIIVIFIDLYFPIQKFLE